MGCCTIGVGAGRLMQPDSPSSMAQRGDVSVTRALARFAESIEILCLSLSSISMPFSFLQCIAIFLVPVRMCLHLGQALEHLVRRLDRLAIYLVRALRLDHIDQFLH